MLSADGARALQHFMWQVDTAGVAHFATDCLVRLGTPV